MISINPHESYHMKHQTASYNILEVKLLDI